MKYSNVKEVKYLFKKPVSIHSKQIMHNGGL